MNVPTHRKGHTLDLVITRDDSSILKSQPIVFISGVSDSRSNSVLDHYAVLCYLNLSRPKTTYKTIKFRAFRKIPIEQFRQSVSEIITTTNDCENVMEIINHYDVKLQGVTDQYAPMQCKTISLRPHAPWYNDELHQDKRDRRRLERIAAHSQLEVDRQIVDELYLKRNKS